MRSDFNRFPIDPFNVSWKKSDPDAGLRLRIWAVFKGFEASGRIEWRDPKTLPAGKYDRVEMPVTQRGHFTALLPAPRAAAKEFYMERTLAGGKTELAGPFPLDLPMTAALSPKGPKPLEHANKLNPMRRGEDDRPGPFFPPSPARLPWTPRPPSHPVRLPIPMCVDAASAARLGAELGFKPHVA